MPWKQPAFRPRGFRRKAEERPSAAARGYCTAAWQRTRLAVIARDGGICQLCGKLVDGKDRDAHIDHIVPKPIGDDSLDNLRLVHRSCHSKRHALER